jgi:hypothetical protein
VISNTQMKSRWLVHWKEGVSCKTAPRIFKAELA